MTTEPINFPFALLLGVNLTNYIYTFAFYCPELPENYHQVVSILTTSNHCPCKKKKKKMFMANRLMGNSHRQTHTGLFVGDKLQLVTYKPILVLLPGKKKSVPTGQRASSRLPACRFSTIISGQDIRWSGIKPFIQW